MKMGLMLTIFFLGFSQELTFWETDLALAKEKAQKENKFILLNFSGSDWCANCIKLKKDLFDSDTFARFSQSALILLNADFPSKKKNSLSPEQKLKNESLADTYNPEGIFPLTLILDSTGKVMGEMKHPCPSANDYIESINKVMSQ